MLGRLLILGFFIALSILAWFGNLYYPHPYLEKIFSTFVALAGIYMIFKLVFEELVSTRIKDSKARYSFRKIVSILYIGIFLVAIVAIWIERPEALLVTYGLIAAGVAVALQDLFKSLAGGLILLITRPYKVGDRIEMNSKYGDVIDIDLLYTTLLEIREWIGGDQATGRITMIPNNAIISSTINNYTKDNNFIWDEITIPITYGSDWEHAIKLVGEIAGKQTAAISKRAKKGLTRIQEKYYLSGRTVEPLIFVRLTDNWIELTVRYVADVRERRALHNTLSRLMLEKIEKSKKVKIASATLEIVGMPDLKVKR